MKWGNELAERKMRNRKFRKVEEAILIAYFKLDNFVNAGRIARLAEISRSTLYRHHATIYGIPQDYTRHLIYQYKKAMNKIINKRNVSVRTVVYCLLTFVITNKKNLIKLLAVGNTEALSEMVDFLKIRVIKEWSNVENPEIVFDIYKGEVMGVMEEWGKAGFPERMKDRVLGAILYFTKTANRLPKALLK